MSCDNVIYYYLREKSKETKIDYSKSKIDFHDCEKDVMIKLKNNGYVQNLEPIAKDTISSELREYINSLLSYELKVTDMTID
jgi:hypothetical protein